MSFRWFLVAALCGLVDGMTSTADAEKPPPNFIVVFIDDMGWGDFSCFGNTVVKTQHIDRLASEGIRFDQFYVNSPICSPSRTALSTGQYPQRWRITSYLSNRRSNAARGMAQWLDPRAPMLARFLNRGGYATGHFGKWHMGGQRDVGEAPLITEYGFDTSLTNFEGLGPRILPLKNAFDGKPPRRHALGSDQLGRGPIRWEDRSTITASFTAAAIEFARRARDRGKPFYINVWPDDVHSPFFPPRQRRGNGTKRQLYHGVLDTMDEQLGRLFAFVRDDSHLRNNTLILVCSDNGPEKGAGSAGPLRGFKTHLFEGGIRSPLVVWGPGLIDPRRAGSRNRRSVFSAIDLVPTLLALAGVSPSSPVAFDGESLPDVLLGRSQASRRQPIFFRRPPDRDAFYGISDLPDLAVREGKWKLLCEYDGSDGLLFNLDVDPAETINRAAEHPEVARRLNRSLLAWHASMPPDGKPDNSKTAKPQAATDQPLLDMRQLLDADTLDIKVLSKWHVVDGDVPTRQKLVTIRVGELVPGRDYRVPVRMIVPLDRKAKGFHLTGGHQLARIRRDARPRGVERELLRGGVGLVHTIVQVPGQFGQAELGRAADERFIKTLDPRHSIQYWGWPATLVRAVTAAHAEKQHFQVGKIALSGASKNGASPSVAILHDRRMTALHSSVAPIWDSPLRLCDRAAWDHLRAENLRYVQELKKDDPTINTRRLLNHRFLGGTFGPVYNPRALAAGHGWNDLQRLAHRMADQVFVARHLPALKARKVDLYFHPGTHDFVAFDMAWGGRHHPQVPVYLRVNSGHGKRADHPARERDEQNKAAFLLQHFFDGVEPLLEPPSVQARVEKRRLLITVSFKPGSRAESGRIWWMYDRGPDGSAAYINELFPRDQWRDMNFDGENNAWTATIDLEPDASRIDFFSNHRKTIRHHSVNYASYLSSPYTRVSLRNK